MLVVAVLIVSAVPVASASAGYKIGGAGQLPLFRIDQLCRDGVRFMAAMVAPYGVDPDVKATHLEHVRFGIPKDLSQDYTRITRPQRLRVPYKEVVDPEVNPAIGYRPLTFTHSADFTMPFDRVLDASVPYVGLYPHDSAIHYSLPVRACMLVDLKPRAPYPNTLSPDLAGAHVDFALLSTREFRPDRLDVTSMRAASGEVQTVTMAPAIGGSFRLSYKDKTTGVIETTEPIHYRATAEEVRSHLTALGTIGTGNVSVAAGYVGGADASGAVAGLWEISFLGPLAGTDLEPLIPDNSGLVPPPAPPNQPAMPPELTVQESKPVEDSTARSIRETDVNNDHIRDVVGRFRVREIVDCAPFMGMLGLRLTARTRNGRTFTGTDEAETVNCS